MASIQKDAESTGLDVTIYIGLNGILEADLSSFSSVHILHICDKPYGISNTLNRALEMIPVGLLWTIADDDDWLVGKFRSDLESLKSHSANTLLLPKCQYSDGYTTSVRPRRPIQDESILNYLYGHFSLWRNNRYITMSGACAEIDFWRRVKFPDIGSREDVTYLIEQEKIGLEIRQSKTVTVRVNIHYRRTVIRDSEIEQTIGWALNFLNQRQLVRFLSSAYSKPFVESGNFQVLKNTFNDWRIQEKLGTQGRLVLSSVLFYWRGVSTLIKVLK